MAITKEVFQAGRELVAAILVADAAWQRVLQHTDDSSAWTAHRAAQIVVTAARLKHTRARIDARIAECHS